MNLRTFSACCCASLTLWACQPASIQSNSQDETPEQAEMNAETPTEGLISEDLKAYVSARVAEFDMIPAERKELLAELAEYVRAKRDSGHTAKLTFVCTHNSRRSHMSQIWAAVGASHYGVEGVETYSGGTEGTAFNPRAVKALQDAGVSIEKTGEDVAEEGAAKPNPVYETRYAYDRQPIRSFSKKYEHEYNPQEGFLAVMTCAQADEACPIVFGSEGRVATTYEDPKAFDGTDREAAAYAERSEQIAREMLYAFSLVGQGV